MDKHIDMINGLDVAQMGDGAPLILLHSLLADRSVFERVESDLARRYRLIMPNLPAHGTSEPLPEPIRIEHYADLVASLADTLDLPSETDVLGNGFGGFVSVALAVKHGNRFGKFIFADTGAGFPDAAKGALRAMADNVEANGMESVLDVAVARMFPPDYLDSHPDIVAERKDCLRQAQAPMFAAAARALTELSLHDQLKDILNPVLVMVGSVDQTTPPFLSHELWHNIPASRYAEIPGCGHCPPIQEPQQFIALLDGFLAGQTRH